MVFGQVISGQEVVREIENQKTDAASKPFAEVRILSCGELVPKSKGKSKYMLTFMCTKQSFFFFYKTVLISWHELYTRVTISMTFLCIFNVFLYFLNVFYLTPYFVHLL